MTSAAAYVEQAQSWARTLEEDERPRCGGDLELARIQLEAKYGVPASTFYALRKRPPKTVPTHIYDRLAVAIEEACSRRMRMLANEIEMAQAAYGKRDRVVRIATSAMALAQKVLGEEQ